MKRVLRAFFKENNIDFKKKKFILAISTGIDSAVLLDAFIKLQKEEVFEIIIAHVNHHVRKQSDDEEKYIREYAQNNNIKCFVKELFFEEKNNFEAEARKKRYQFFLELMESEKADYLVLAHHGCDNIETIIMRIIRGSSLAGYSGMQEITLMKGHKVIRPFLNIDRSDIEKYQKEQNVIYFEDETNALNDYKRNRIRKEIVPKLFSESDDLINKFVEFRKTIYEASLVVNEVRDKFIKDNIMMNEDIIIDRDKFLALNDFLQEEVLFEILKPYSLSKVSIKELIKIIKSEQKNYFNKYKNLFSFIIEYDKVIISEKNQASLSGEVIITGLGEYILGDKKIICVSEKSDKTNYNLNEMWYNIDMLPVVIRYRQNGDLMVINGHEKKLKELFIDMKVPMLKRNATILAVKDEQVLMAFGLKKSDELKKIAQRNIKIIISEENNG